MYISSIIYIFCNKLIVGIQPQIFSGSFHKLGKSTVSALSTVANNWNQSLDIDVSLFSAVDSKLSL